MESLSQKNGKTWDKRKGFNNDAEAFSTQGGIHLW